MTQTLLKIKSDDTVNKTTDNATYGSDLIVNENGVLVYYCGTVCKSINVTSAKVVVVAYKNGVAVAIGTTATTVNLAA